MSNFFATHRKIRWFGLSLAALLLAVVLFTIFFDWNDLRPAVAHIISEETGRRAAINGNLRVHLWSWNPSAQVDGLTIDNPPWAAQRVMFAADQLGVSVSLGRLLLGQLVLPQIRLVRPTVDLERDAKGRASWDLGTAAGKPQRPSRRPAKIPPIRRLLIEDGRIRIADSIRKLTLTGSVNAADVAHRPGAGFELQCTGSLNAKPFRAELRGGPLINLDPDHPYDLDAHVTASDITLHARTHFPKPFDMAEYHVKLEISGNDLADVYYLTGLALPDTPPYRLAADIEHRGTIFRLDDLEGKLGSSDVAGQVEVQTGRSRPKLVARIHSKRLDLIDLAPVLGHPAAGGEPPPRGPAAPQRLFPDADLQMNRVRGMDADVSYRANAVIAPKMPMKEVSFHLLLNDGLLRIDPLAFVLKAGKFDGSVTIDARSSVPQSTIDMALDDVDLGQFKPAKAQQPPLQGSLVGRVEIRGRGASVHKLAASADGTISVALPHGEMNDAFAELTGIDVMKGLGLLLSPKQPNVQIRCGVIDFRARNGTLDSRSVFIDTSTVLITGRGHIDLGDERLDLSLQGDPKKLRLFRLRTPITLRGTLMHPRIGVKPGALLAQAGVATALGTLLTPFAAALAFIDPGLAKNKDCAAVIAQAGADVSDQPPRGAAPKTPP
ncbi:MAG TPA: AsmA family protein [Steroidobacteraceae bacterium]|nr:AsmA family protein [Steroidobacteraceae bacterium]